MPRFMHAIGKPAYDLRLLTRRNSNQNDVILLIDQRFQ